MIQKTDASVIW